MNKNEKLRALLASSSAPTRRSKFNAKRTTVDGITFDSQKEARRWSELKMLTKAGQIRSVRRQRAYELMVNGERVGAYVADFVYEKFKQPGQSKECETVVEDCKGVRTPLYQLKKKIFEAQYGIQILET